MYNFKEWIISLFGKLKETFLNGKKWIGYDGLLNLETSALMVIVFFVFFHYSLAVLFVSLCSGVSMIVALVLSQTFFVPSGKLPITFLLLS